MAIQQVLIVEDSKTETVFLTELLESNGYQVRTAVNADDALLRLEESKPDLILMDVVMPGANGFQFTRKLSKDAEYGAIPIFICSSKNLETDRIWGLRQGASEYFVKPINAKELIAKIKAWSPEGIDV